MPPPLPPQPTSSAPTPTVVDGWVWRCARPLACLSLVLSSCGSPEGPDPADLRARFDLEALGAVPYPTDNQYNADRVALGRLLFYDPILAGEKDVACGTCHHPDLAFTDGRQFAAGVSGTGFGAGRTLSTSAVTGDPIPLVGRNALSVLNTGLAERDEDARADALMFWDGRAVGLEGQVLVPIASRREMRGDAYEAAVALDSVAARLSQIPEYVTRFTAAFPGETAITSNTLARAVAAYERELVTRDAPFDHFVAGDDDALTASQLRGLELFFTRAKCFICHHGPMFSNYQFMVTGAPQEGPGKDVIPGDDTGREEHTGLLEDRYRFRVPSLRNVEITPPYMHDGVFHSLTQIVEFYNAGAQPRHTSVSDDDVEVVIRTPLGLTAEEVEDVVAFLRSLTDPGRLLDAELVTVPAIVPSGLTPLFGVRAIP